MLSGQRRDASGSTLSISMRWNASSTAAGRGEECNGKEETTRVHCARRARRHAPVCDRGYTLIASFINAVKKSL